MILKKAAAAAAALIISATLDTPAASAQASFGMSSQMSSSATTSGTGNSATGLTTRTVTVNGTPRTYLVQAPASVKDSPKAKTLPVILGFSGWKSSARTFESYSRFSNVASGNAIIVYPEGLSNSQGQGWEGPRYAPTSRGQDVAFARQIVRDLRNQYSVGSVYAAGLSNGGGMALALACQAPDLVDAVAGVSTAFYTPLFNNCSGRVPTLLIHGTKDDVAPYSRGGSNSHGGSYYSAQEAFRRISQRNGCMTAVAPTAISLGGYDSISHAGCNAQTTLYRVNNGTHTWYTGFNANVATPNASREIWNFFRNS